MFTVSQDTTKAKQTLWLHSKSRSNSMLHLIGISQSYWERLRYRMLNIISDKWKHKQSKCHDVNNR